MDIDQAVARAIAEHEAWARKATPSIVTVQPRVLVVDPLGGGLRRPFQVKGRGWCVRIAGVARLVDPRENEHGEIVFGITYGK